MAAYLFFQTMFSLDAWTVFRPFQTPYVTLMVRTEDWTHAKVFGIKRGSMEARILPRVLGQVQRGVR